MKLRIVAVNDVYSLENLPRLQTLIERARTRDPADLLLVTIAGDFLSPSILSSIDGGRGMVDVLNTLGVTHVTFGNHEDDLESSELLLRTRELRATWLATNARDFAPELPASDVVEADGVRVGLLGVVMTDPSVYRRAPFGGKVTPANAAALAEAKRLVDEEGCAFVIPLTHQFVAQDRALAREARAADLPIPVILGGHEHEPFVEQVDGTWIVKAGHDAERAVVIDVVSGEAKKAPTASARLETVASCPEDPRTRARVDSHMQRVVELERATLLTLAPGETLSSVGARARQTTLGELLCSKVRDALGAEVGLLNGGGIRGSRTYDGAFTYGDLREEVPFDNEIVVARLPGRVIREAVAASRAHAPAESGGFLQVDDGVRVDDAHQVVAIGGAPLDPDRDYRVALVRNFFVGLDRIEPLVRFAEEHPDRVPPVDSGRDVRVVLVDAFSIALFRRIGGFDAIDVNHDDRITLPELAAALERETRSPVRVTAKLIMHALDTNGDEVVTREEAEAALPHPEE